MLKSVNTRIKESIGLLLKSNAYAKESRRNIADFRENNGSYISLENALTNNRIALEGYCEALMALYGLFEKDLYLYLHIRSCKKKAEATLDNTFNLKHLNKKDMSRNFSLSEKIDFLIDYIKIPDKDAAIMRKAKKYGNEGSHFNEKKVKLDDVEEICIATAGLLIGERFYLKSSNIDTERINKQTLRVFTEFKIEASYLQKKSCKQCEYDLGALRVAEGNNNNYQQTEKKRRNLQKSREDNIILTQFRKRYEDVCLEFNEANIEDRFQTYKDIEQYIANQNKGNDIAKTINSKVNDLKQTLFETQGMKASKSDFVKSITILCIAVLLLFALLLFLSSTTTPQTP